MKDRNININEDAGAVVLMLDNQCLPPCYCFETDSREVCSVSPEILDEVLEWVSQFKPSPPSMMYMVGAPQELDEEVQKVLEDVADSVICAPMQTAEQEKAGLSVSNTQMVVFPSLADFEKDHGIARGRSCIVHIGCEEISRWSEILKAQATKIDVPRLRFRPRNLHQWDQSHLKAYRNQIFEIEAFKCHLNAAGVSVGWELRSFSRCPAMRTLVTIGPDGLCYPCPTFYYAGQTNGLGAIKTLASDRLFLQDSKQTCRLCQSGHCEACLFWESGHVTGEVTTCELPTDIDKETSWEQITWDNDRSGYSWLKRIFMKTKKKWAFRYSMFIMKKGKWALRPSNTRSLYYRLIRSKFVLKMIKPPASFRKSPLILHSSQLETCVCNGLPEIHEYKNVLFVPEFSAVYNDNGGLIGTSILKRSLGQRQVHNPPVFIDVQQVKHSEVIDMALFGGVMFAHFGHFLLESLSRLWPLAVSDMEKELFECDVLYWAPDYKTGTKTYSVTKVKRTIFESLNINIKPNLRILNQPVLINKLIIPDQAIILESEIYPIFRTLLKNAGDRIIRMYSQSRKDEYKDKVYLSRSSLSLSQRNCINEKKLENILKDHGFGIFHIHEFSIADQIGLFNNAEIIVGPDGSAFHAMLLSETSEKAILYLVCGEPESTYTGIDRICEADSKYIKCMYPHPLCLKSRRPKDTIIDIPKACQGIIQHI
jgi:hypothetical protein